MPIIGSLTWAPTGKWRQVGPKRDKLLVGKVRDCACFLGLVLMSTKMEKYNYVCAWRLSRSTRHRFGFLAGKSKILCILNGRSKCKGFSISQQWGQICSPTSMYSSTLLILVGQVVWTQRKPKKRTFQEQSCLGFQGEHQTQSSFEIRAKWKFWILVIFLMLHIGEFSWKSVQI